jgi:uncharacterized delta-60 repeat protein
MNRKPHASLTTIEPLESRQLLSFGQAVQEFGVAGRTTFDFNGASSPAEMLIDASGRIITAADGGIARYTAAGQPDVGFGTGGKVALSGLSVRDVALDSSGKIVVLASGASGSLILRFTSAGKSDKAFGTNGAALVTASKKFVPKALAIQSDGKFVIVGSNKTADNKGNTTKVFRLTSAGGTDGSFDGDGVADLQLASTDLLNPTPSDTIVNLHVGAGNVITVLGGSQAFSPGGWDEETQQFFDATYGDAQLVAARLTDSGALDGNFGGGGYARHVYHSGSAVAYGATSGLLLADGSIAIANVNTSNRLLVDRFTSGGAFVREDVSSALRFGQTWQQDMTQLPDGRLAIIADDYSGGFVVFTLDAGGDLGPPVRPTNASGNSAFSTFLGVQIAAAGDDLVLCGASQLTSFAQALLKIDAGTPEDRPDHRAGGTASDVVIDSTGAVHLAYHDSVNQSLVYVYRDTAGVWSSPRTIDGKRRAGQHLSIAVDSANRPAIAYYDGLNGDLKLAQLNSKRKWVLSLLDSKGTTGQYPSLRFNPTTQWISVAYYYKNGGDLKFITQENGTWVYENVDLNGNAGQFASLVYTPKSKVPSVAYADSAGNLKYGVRSKPGRWTLTSVAQNTGASYIDMAYGGYFDRGAISYYDANAADLKLAHFDGTTWQNRTVATSGAQGQYTQVYAPQSSWLYILSYNRSKNRVDLHRTAWDHNADNTVTTVHGSYGKHLAAAFASNDNFVAAGLDTSRNDLKVIDGLVV